MQSAQLLLLLEAFSLVLILSYVVLRGVDLFALKRKIIMGADRQSVVLVAQYLPVGSHLFIVKILLLAF